MTTRGTRKPTTEVTHSEEFLALAATQPRESLIYMFVSAFGFTLLQALVVVKKVIASKDVQMAAMILDASVQIRGNVTYVGDGFAGARTKYPTLIIKGRKDVNDIFNFGALHICGHVLCNLGARNRNQDWYEGALAKAGSCIDGRDSDYPDNEAGKINKEIRNSWSKTQVQRYEEAASEIFGAGGVSVWLEELHEGIEPMFEAFGALLTQAQG